MSVGHSIQVDQHTELRRAASPGFWEMWIGGTFVGMYYSLDRARAAAASSYAALCRRRYAGSWS